MARPSSLGTSKEKIRQGLVGSRQRVFTATQVGTLFDMHKAEWGITRSTPPSRFLEFIVEQGLIEKRELRPENPEYKPFTRYLLEDASGFEVALSLRARSYLTHATAVSLHGLSDQLPKVVYANQEQSSKGGGGELTQAGLDRAFSSRQRVSAYIYWYGEQRIVLLSGKATGNLGVTTIAGPRGEELRATCLERTLIDIVVRPVYAGGVYQVLEAFRGALGKISVTRLIEILKDIHHLYPYHQAIGFLMDRAGFPESDTSRLKKLGTQFDFYLAHGLKEREYDKSWRLFYPRGF